MYLITGSSGHLGEALMRVLRERGMPARGMDRQPGPFTDALGDIADAAFVAPHMRGVTAVLHTATLHKPHVETHSRQAFVDTNVSGTLTLLQAATAAGVQAFVFTSTTSLFGDAMRPGPGAPAVWIDEDVVPITKNIYGATKRAAEDLCWLTHRSDGLNCLILRTSRFFPEDQDDAANRAAFSRQNMQVLEFLHRRADVEDIVEAHLLAARRAPQIGFGRYIVSATSPFTRADLPGLRTDPGAVVERYVPFKVDFDRLGWRMVDSIDRVYDNSRARTELGWQPRHDFASVLARVRAGQPALSELAQAVGAKLYHAERFLGEPYPVACE